MVKKGTKVFLLRVGLCLLWIISLAQASENEFSSSRTEALSNQSSFLDDWQATLIISPELNSSPSFQDLIKQDSQPKKLEESFTQSLTIDCSMLLKNLPGNGPYIYASTSQKISKTTFYRCKNTQSNLIGILFINLNKLDTSSFDTLFSSFYEKSINSNNGIIIANLCRNGYFELETSKCIKHDKFKRTLANNYDDMIGGGTYVLTAITMVATEDSLDYELFTTLIVDYITEVSCGADSCNEGSACSVPGYSEIAIQAAMLLFSKAIDFPETTDDQIRTLLDSLSCVKFAVDIKNFEQSSLDNLNCAIYGYLDYWSLEYGIASTQYFNSAESSYNFLINFYSMIFQGGYESSTFEDMLIESSSINVCKNDHCEICSGTKEIIVKAVIGLGSSIDGNCDFNNEDDINLEFLMRGIEFGPDSDFVAYNIATIGTSGVPNNYFETVVWGDFSNDCFHKTFYISLHAEHDNWIIINPVSEPYAINQDSASYYQIDITTSGIYFLTIDCSTKDFKLNTVDVECNCDRHCSQCMSESTCTTCSSDYQLITTSNYDLCKCPAGKFDDGIGCMNCDESCETCVNIATCTTCVSDYTLGTIAADKILCCRNGYYPTISGCEECNESCEVCINDSTCTTCIADYTLGTAAVDTILCYSKDKNTLANNYYEMINGGTYVLTAITMVATEDSLDYELFTILLVDYIAEVACGIDSCNEGSACSVPGYSEIAIQAAMFLLSKAIDFPETTDDQIRNLLDSLSCVKFAVDIKNFEQSSLDNLNCAIYGYLDYWSLEYGIASTQYFDSAESSYNFLANFYLMFFQGGSEYSDFTDTTLEASSINVCKNYNYEICSGTREINTIVVGTKGTEIDGNCDFNDEDDIIMEFLMRGIEFGPDSDFIAYDVALIGNSDFLDNYFEDAVWGDFSNDCFLKTFYISYYAEHDNWITVNPRSELHIINQNDESYHQIDITTSGIYFLTIDCSTKDLKLNTVDIKCNCNRHCSQCMSEITCTTCSSNYQFINNDLCECPAGKFDDGVGCIDCEKSCETCVNIATCTTCAKGHTLGTINPDLILCCGDGYYPAITGCEKCNKSCKTCVNDSTCTACAVDYTFSTTATDATLCCSDGYYPTITGCEKCDSSCSKCINNKFCEVCIKNWLKDTSNSNYPNVLCEESKYYWDASYLEYFKYDYTYGYLLLRSNKRFLYNIDVSLENITSTANSCAFYFADVSFLATNTICTLKNPFELQIKLGDWFSVDRSTVFTSAKSFIMKEGTLKIYNGGTKIMLSEFSEDSKAIILGNDEIVYDCSGSSTYTYAASQSFGLGSKSFEYFWSVLGEGVTLSDHNSQIVDVTVTSPNLALFTLNLQVSINSKTFSSSLKVAVHTSENKFTFGLNTGNKAYFTKGTSFSLIPQNINRCEFMGTFTFKWNIFNPYTTIEYTSTSEVLAPLLNTRKLRIPKYYMDYNNDYIFMLTITLTNGETVKTAFAKSLISITKSPLVLGFSRGYENLLDINSDFVIDASGSYDPDDKNLISTLTPVWTSNEPSILFGIDANSLAITIPSANYGSLTYFTLKLTLTSTSGMSDSSIISVTLSRDAKYDVRLKHQGIKLKNSNYSQLKIQSTLVSSVTGIPIINLVEVSGPYYLIYSTSSIITLTLNLLIPGASYAFKSYMNLDSVDIGNTITYVRINQGPVCIKDSAAIVSPSVGTSMSTSFKITLSHCYDGDEEDLPLQYKISGIRDSTCCSISLIGQSENNIITGFKFSKGYSAIEYTINDALGDTIKKKSNSFIISSRLRSLKDSQNLIDEYYQLTTNQNVISVISLFLDEYENPAQLLDIMWSDFNNNLDSFTGQEYIEVVSSIIYVFLDSNQNQVLIKERLPIYISFLNNAFSEMKYYDESIDKRILKISEIIITIDPSIDNVFLAKEILQNLFDVQEIMGSEGYYQNNPHCSIFEVENFANILRLRPMILGNNIIEIGELNVKKNIIVKIKALSFAIGNFSDIIDLTIMIEKRIEGTDIIAHDAVYFDIDNDAFIVKMRFTGINRATCKSYKSGNWEEGDCDVLSYEDGIAKVSIKRSGTFQLFEYSSDYSSQVPLYIIFSLILIMTIFIPFMIYLDKKNTYFSVPTTSISIETRTEKDKEEKEKEKIYTEIIRNENYDHSIFTYHLLFSMFKLDRSFSRSRKLMIICTNVIFGLFIQVCLLKFTSISALAVGVISAIVVIVPSALIIFLFRGTSNCKLALGTAIILVLNITSVVGSWLIPGSKGWLVSWLAGLGTEFGVSQGILMIASKVILH
ncbi:hypothetical protein SteCoe_23294 [Stentor coeruleus]|uniref:TNFR-Cys domain-containing protein n=1 Tax=Stentor coeruleus TaxID=5963 RepID=A0A1R2BK51_9CILI|nr:hypothetical protein SteCoe_23294 [Stentor coeruleus]